MARVLDRLGRSAARHHWWFIGAWLMAAVLCVVIAITLDGQTNDTFKTPGAQSQQALDLLESRFPSQAGATATVVFDAPQGVADPQVQPAIQASIANLEKLPHVSSVGNLITATNEQFAGKIALVTAQYDTQAQDVGLDAYTLLQQATQPAADAGVKLAFGGAVVDYANKAPSGDADLIGLLAAVIILLFAFGSVVAMGLPILTALFGLGVGVALDQHRRRVHDHRHARAHPRHDDRTGRRDRLLAVHRHALSREHRRRHGHRRGGRATRSPPPVKRCCSQDARW